MPFKKLHAWILSRDFPDMGLLIARIGFGGMMFFGHGLGKLWNFSEAASRFPDPIGLGPEWSFAMAVFGEFFCALAIMLGWMMRYATVPFIITMMVATFIHHGADPFPDKEKALLYMVAGITLFLTGPGRFKV